MATINAAISLGVAVRVDSTNEETRAVLPVITLTQTKSPYKVELVEVTGTT